MEDSKMKLLELCDSVLELNELGKRYPCSYNNPTNAQLLARACKLLKELNDALIESHEVTYHDNFWLSPMGLKTKRILSEVDKLMEEV